MFQIWNIFTNAQSFNQDISSWNTSSVANMSYMFSSADSFNQPLNNWDVSNVSNMEGCSIGNNFNQPLNNWDLKMLLT